MEVVPEILSIPGHVLRGECTGQVRVTGWPRSWL